MVLEKAKFFLGEMLFNKFSLFLLLNVLFLPFCKSDQMAFSLDTFIL